MPPPTYSPRRHWCLHNEVQKSLKKQQVLLTTKIVKKAILIERLRKEIELEKRNLEVNKTTQEEVLKTLERLADEAVRRVSPVKSKPVKKVSPVKSEPVKKVSPVKSEPAE